MDDREQLLRMAGNIACGLVGLVDQDYIAVNAAAIAVDTMSEVDRLIAVHNTPDAEARAEALREAARRGYSWEDEEGRYIIPDVLVKKIKSDALKDAAERDIAGEVWDLLFEHLDPTIRRRGITSIYEEMRKKFPVPAILADDQNKGE